MSFVNPPHREMRLFQNREPLRAPVIELLVHGLPHEALEAFLVAPHTQIDDDRRIIKSADVGRVAALVLQTPDEPVAALGNRR